MAFSSHRALARPALARPALASAALASVALSILAGSSQAQFGPDPGPIDCAVDPARELMIRDLSVVEDCVRTTWGPCLTHEELGARGAWTFGTLMAGVAGTNHPDVLSDFVLEWLRHWERDVQVNSFTSPARPSIRDLVIDPWLHASGGSRLDMRVAPFRLLAIVNRVDLRQQAAYGGSSAGEARFVFGVLDLDNPSAVPSFTVIFEYRIESPSCEETKAWGQRWHALGSLPFGPSFNRALQQITDSFTAIGAAPSRPNGSSISQIRTNEIALAGPWELREFRLAPDPFSESVVAPLRQTTVKLNPNHSVLAGEDLLGSQLVADFVNEFEADILSGSFDVPELYQGKPFLGAATVSLIDFWNGFASPPIHSNEARHVFSLNTCNGCHGRETNTGFLQVAPRPLGSVAQLSGFLTGIDVSDPIVPQTVRHFDDLQRRADDLCRLLSTPCSELVNDPPFARTH